MTRRDELRDALKESGVTVTFLAAYLGCTRNRIYAILNGSECKASEIVKITEALHLNQEQRDHIFLG